MTRQYPNSLAALDKDFAEAKAKHPQSDVTKIAGALIEKAKEYDLGKSANLGISGRYVGVSRDCDNPVDYTDPSILGADWADHPDSPLRAGEKWNEGRRATKTGTVYDFDEDDRPINPYHDTGLRGQGCLGAMGPNHTVDNGILVVKPDENGDEALYALGILRKFDGDVPAFSGGFAKLKKEADGSFSIDRETIIDSQVEEFFEEMVSGSIDLRPDYAARLSEMFNHEVQKREAVSGVVLSDAEKELIHEETETHLKLQQVQDLDPGFMQRLRSIVADGRECFAGPVLSADRATNNAWVETSLSWFVLDDAVWEHIKGDNPVFDYQFTAGDDASGVQMFRIDEELITNAFDSHGAMFTFMVASYLLHEQAQGKQIAPSIKTQAAQLKYALKV
jgi:hypothetical protein